MGLFNGFRLHGRMGDEVLAEAVAKGKALVAHLALVGAFGRVLSSLMRPEPVFGREGSVADITCVEFLGRGGFHVA